MKKISVGLCAFALLGVLASSGHSQRSAAAYLAGEEQAAAGPRSAWVHVGDSTDGPGSAVRQDQGFGRLPLYFIANEGQVKADVDFYVQGADKTISFGAGGITFSLQKPRENRRRGERRPGTETPAVQVEDTAAWGVKLDFVGADREVRPKGGDKAEGVVSYFKGMPADWKTGIPMYSRLTYSGLWPGIDLEYSGTVQQLKYEFVVAPGADPGLIRLAYRGASEVRLADSGRLAVATPCGGFEDGVPVAYQEVDGRRLPVPVAYALEAPEAAGLSPSYYFRVGDYDRSRPLVIDPVVFVYCGFIGGVGDEAAYDIAVDGLGNVYLTGAVSSDPGSFPVTVGPSLIRHLGNEAFVAKLGSFGTTLVYCGYLGGDGYDYAEGIAVDGAGNAYITGITESTPATFPVLAGPDLSANGYTDAFVAKINASGTGLAYCGYIGGSLEDAGYAIAVDGAGAAYIAGTTHSTQTSFPEAVGPDLTQNGGFDGFVAKVGPAGTSLSYCGFIGGSVNDGALGIAVDGSGNAYVTGHALSTEATFPEAVGPDLTHNGGIDAYVAKVNAGGTSLVYCGYIGGSGTEYGEDIAVDISGNACIAGETGSSELTFPVLVGPDLTANGSYDAFLAKINAGGTGLVYCGYVGGSSSESGYGLALDSAGNAFLTGVTDSDETSFPVTGALGSAYAGNEDAFLVKVDPAGAGLRYAGYLGGSEEDYGYAAAVDTAGSVYLAGYTLSTEADFPVYIGPDVTGNGFYDIWVAKIAEEPIWKPRAAAGDFQGDTAAEAVFDLGAAGTWMYDPPNWSMLTAANPEGLLAAEVDGDPFAEIIADLGFGGLWVWNGGVWGQLSGANVDGLAAGDTDGDGLDELVCDFGLAGMWRYDAGSWTQMSGVNADQVAVADLDAAGGREIVGDFGAVGLWVWKAGNWLHLSNVDADYVTFGDIDGTAGDELIGDFGATGLWTWSSAGGGLWTQLSGVNADYMIAADLDDSGDDAIIGDFAGTGLWLYELGEWTILSGVDADFLIRGDVDVDAADEVLVDFGATGLWLADAGVWSQLSGVNADSLLSVELDWDFSEEVLADFGPLGIYQWDGGVWSQISASNPE